jgi:ABC-type nitrate/sulfonate/bicarbonate transport system permease component
MSLKLLQKIIAHKDRYLSFVVPSVFLVVWYVVTQFGLVKTLYLPHPFSVIAAAYDTRDTILLHAMATLLRLIAGYLIGICVGFFLGLLMKYSYIVDRLLYKLVEAWRPVPPVALVPFFILWFGFSSFGKILLITLGVALIMVVNTYEAVNNVKPIFIKAAYSLGASKTTVFRTVIIPAILPELKAGLRISLAIGFALVIVSEYMGADYGLGYLINISKITFSTQTILLAILIIGLIAVFLDQLVQRITNRLTAWAPKIHEAVQVQEIKNLN